jgi:hypothetical protein
MIVTFGEGCDGDAQQMIFSRIIGWNVTVTDKGHEWYGEVADVTNEAGGHLLLEVLDPDTGEPKYRLPVYFNLNDPIEIEIH